MGGKKETTRQVSITMDGEAFCAMYSLRRSWWESVPEILPVAALVGKKKAGI